ncbi:oleate hydratase [Nostoc sp.]|uniref:oleate hydratase n=1 Tax=Nostoc sp. TaxID=1180 RepID=UPI002FF9EA1C
MTWVNKSNAYLLGGGIGSLAAAAFMIRDGGISGGNIFILEAKPLLGGSMDGGGNFSGGLPKESHQPHKIALLPCPMPNAQ